MLKRYFAIGGILILSLLTGFAACINPRIGYAPEQPVKFSHHVHVGVNEINCTYCHAKVTQGPKASLPGADTCMNCHSQVKGSTDAYQREIKKVREAWRTGTPIRWVKVHDLPDHVQFSHQPHILRGVQCSECHGQIPKSDIEKDLSDYDNIAVEKRFNMGWCIECHRQQDYVPEGATPKAPNTRVQNASTNCATCHY